MLKEFLRENYENIKLLQHSKINVLDRDFETYFQRKYLILLIRRSVETPLARQS
jgi:hypothetical protein